MTIQLSIVLVLVLVVWVFSKVFSKRNSPEYIQAKEELQRAKDNAYICRKSNKSSGLYMAIVCIVLSIVMALVMTSSPTASQFSTDVAGFGCAIGMLIGVPVLFIGGLCVILAFVKDIFGGK